MGSLDAPTQQTYKPAEFFSTALGRRPLQYQVLELTAAVVTRVVLSESLSLQCGTSFGSTLHGYTCQASPSATHDPGDPKEACMRCGPEARNWRGYDHTITSSIPWEQRPYCDWNVSFRGAFKNHLVLPSKNDYSSPDHTQAVALFRDPRRRLVSGWNDNKCGGA